MADNNRYELVVTLPDGAGNRPVSNASINAEQDESGQEKGYWAQNAESAKAAAQKLVSVGTGYAVAKSFINYEVSSVSVRTGAKEYEQKLQLLTSTAEQTLVPIVIGAKAGGLLGAGVGLIASFAMQAITWGQNAQTIRYNQQIENISIEMANRRAGVSGSRSSNQ